MNEINYHKFISWLLLRFAVYGPKQKGERVCFGKIKTAGEIEFYAKPFYPLREFFLPCPETLHQNGKNDIAAANSEGRKRIILNIPLYDLEALSYLMIIFGRDPYFQKHLRNTVICGISAVPDDNSFAQKFEDKILRHLKFDLYFDQNKDGSFRLFTGSEQGQKILETFGEKDYAHIEYRGPLNNLSFFPSKIKEKIKASRGAKIWKDLGKKCLACGKCSLVCPLCYCYDLKTSSEGKVSREWGNCFYSEFSEVAGGHKFLKNIEERIYNWYDHKFARMIEEYGFAGCVQCGRCSDVCPAGINIRKNLENINKLK